MTIGSARPLEDAARHRLQGAGAVDGANTATTAGTLHECSASAASAAGNFVDPKYNRRPAIDKKYLAPAP